MYLMVYDHHFSEAPPEGVLDLVTNRKGAIFLSVPEGGHFSHSTTHITAISPFTPSSAACLVGVQFLPWMRRGSAVSSSTTTYC